MRGLANGRGSKEGIPVLERQEVVTYYAQQTLGNGFLNGEQPQRRQRRDSSNRYRPPLHLYTYHHTIFNPRHVIYFFFKHVKVVENLLYSVSFC